MNKIFLILVLIASSYGQAYILLGAGALDCSEYLDSAEKGRYATDMGLFGGYAQGVFTTMNMLSEIGGLPYKEGDMITPEEFDEFDLDTVRKINEVEIKRYNKYIEQVLKK